MENGSCYGTDYRSIASLVTASVVIIKCCGLSVGLDIVFIGGDRKHHNELAVNNWSVTVYY